MTSKKKQTGSVLIIVLLLVVSMIALASFMTLNSRSAIQRSTKIEQYQQMSHYVSSAHQLMKILLQTSLHGQPVISADQPWAVPGASYPLDNAVLQGTLSDARNCYNINALNNLTEDRQGRWPDVAIRLIDLMVIVKIPSAKANKLAASIWDYVDSNAVAHRGGAEDAVYLSKKSAYLAANQPIVDVSELRVIEGMTPDFYQKLEPHLCALPDSHLSINVNTLKAEQAPLLQAFTQSKLTPKVIERWLKNRPLGGWQSVEQALKSPELSGLSPDDKAELTPYLRINTDYFRFDGKLTADDMSYQWFTLWQWQDPQAREVLHMELAQ